MSAFAKLSAAADFLWRRPVSLKWLLRTHTRLDPAFLRDHRIQTELAGDDLICVRVDGVPFLWPRSADLEPLKHLLAELLTDGHPHQYEFGPTPLTSDDVLLDIGCCEGGFAARAAERGAAVIAVEPSRRMGEVIRRLFQLRDLPPPQIVECLLGEAAGTAYFEENAHDPAQSRVTDAQVPGSYPVRRMTLDELTGSLERKPSYIKCDAEGADLAILRSGRNFLQTTRPKIAVTTYHNSNDFVETRDYLRSLGYELEAKGIIYMNGELRVMMIHAA